MIQPLSKYTSYIFTFLLTLGMIFGISTYAATPEKTLGFQGQLFESNTPKTGSVNATFTFYDAATGGNTTGTPIAKTVTVSNGYFGTQFTESDTTGVDFNQQLYVEVSINGTTLSPRTAINPTVSSLKSFGTFSYASAPSVGPVGSLYFNTTDNTLYMSNGTSWSPSSPWVTVGTSTSYMGNVGIGTSTSNSSLTVAGQVNILGGSGASNILMSDVDLSTSTRSSGDNILIGAAQFPNGGTFNSTIIGKGAYTGGGSNDYNNVVIGRNASVVSLTDPNGVPNAVVIGGGAKSYYGGVTVVGRGAEARGNLSIAIGEVAIASSSNAIIVGRVSTVTGVNSAIFGGGNTLTQDNAYVYGHSIGTNSGGVISHGFGTLTPIDTSRVTIRSRSSTSSSLTLISSRSSISNGLLLGGIDFRSDDSDLSTGGTTTASILALANQSHTASALGTDLVFNTTNGTTTVEALRILGNGNVGIGSSTPIAKLSIHSNFGETNPFLLAIASSTSATNSPNIFSINSAGVVAINKSGNLSPLTSAGTDSQVSLRIFGVQGQQNTIIMHAFGNANNVLAGYSTAGTPDAPTATLMGTPLLRLAGGGHTGASYIAKAEIAMVASEDWSATSTGVDIRFFTTALGSTARTEKMRIDANGNVGIGTTNPLHALDVYGDCIAFLGSCIGATSSTNLVEYVATTFQFSEDGTVTNALTRYLTYAGGTIATTDIASVVITRNGILKNFYVRADSNSLTGASTFEVMKNGSATGYFVTLDAAAVSASNSTSTVAVFAGDKISLRLVTLGTGSLVRPMASFEQIVTTNVFSTSQWVTSTTSSSTIIYNGTAQLTNLLGGATTLSTDANGNIIRTPSDQKLKTNVETLTSALEKVNAMRGVSYNWLDTNRFGPDKEIGFIAQELETIVPEVVKSGGEYKSVNYQNLTALLTEAIKELSSKFDGLRKLVETDEVKTKKLCIGNTCITEQEFKQVLQNRSATPQAPTPTPTPEPEKTDETVAEPTPQEQSPAPEPEPTPDAPVTE